MQVVVSSCVHSAHLPHWDLCPKLGCVSLAEWCQEILTSLVKRIGVEKKLLKEVAVYSL